MILGGGPEPLGAHEVGQSQQISDDPCPWGFAFHTVHETGCAEVGLYVDYM